jgi:selenocysteine-specific elongation factor
LQRLEALVSGDVEQAVGATLLSAAGLTVAQIVAMTGFTQIEVQTAVDRLLRHGSVIHVGSLYIGRPAWDVLAARASVALQRFHAENPLQRGMTREELRSKLHRSREEWPAWLHTLIEQGIVQADGASVWLPGFENEVGPRGEEFDRVLAALSLHPFAPPTGRELEAQARTDDSMLAFMVQSGKIVHVGGGVYFESGAFDQLVALALEIIDREGAVSMAAFRDAAGTSRKYAQAFLEYLDARRITRRQGDLRLRGREAPACA